MNEEFAKIEFQNSAGPGVTVRDHGVDDQAGAEAAAFPDQAGAAAPHYLDVGDNVHANVCDWLSANCGDRDNRWFIPMTCENGHRLAKVIVCGKEWCPVCGLKNSMAHNRRFVRWLPKVNQFKRMRYIVLTIPESVRQEFRTKEALKDLGRQAQTIMQKLGYKRGLRRWHWFGDKSTKWNPHLNILVEGGYMRAEKLATLKLCWAALLGVDVVSVNASYKKSTADMAGCLNYVTRATFLDYNWDIEMALELRNFRNMVVWGRTVKDKDTGECKEWGGQPWGSVWDLDPADREAISGEALDVEAIENIINHRCPRFGCGAKLTAGKALPVLLIDGEDMTGYGAGYYSLEDRAPPPVDRGVLERLEQLKLFRLAKFRGWL